MFFCEVTPFFSHLSIPYFKTLFRERLTLSTYLFCTPRSGFSTNNFTSRKTFVLEQKMLKQFYSFYRFFFICIKSLKVINDAFLRLPLVFHLGKSAEKEPRGYTVTRCFNQPNVNRIGCFCGRVKTCGWVNAIAPESNVEWWHDTGQRKRKKQSAPSRPVFSCRINRFAEDGTGRKMV